MSEGLSDENLCRKISKKIQKQLTGLQNGIKYEMPDDKNHLVSINRPRRKAEMFHPINRRLVIRFNFA